MCNLVAYPVRRGLSPTVRLARDAAGDDRLPGVFHPDYLWRAATREHHVHATPLAAHYYRRWHPLWFCHQRLPAAGSAACTPPADAVTGAPYTHLRPHRCAACRSGERSRRRPPSTPAPSPVLSGERGGLDHWTAVRTDGIGDAPCRGR